MVNFQPFMKTCIPTVQTTNFNIMYHWLKPLWTNLRNRKRVNFIIKTALYNLNSLLPCNMAWTYYYFRAKHETQFSVSTYHPSCSLFKSAISISNFNLLTSHNNISRSVVTASNSCFSSSISWHCRCIIATLLSSDFCSSSSDSNTSDNPAFILSLMFKITLPSRSELLYTFDISQQPIADSSLLGQPSVQAVAFDHLGVSRLHTFLLYDLGNVKLGCRWQ